MYHFFNLRNLPFKQSQGVGVGHHHGRNGVAADAVNQGAQRLDVDGAVDERLHLHDVQSADGRRSRVRAVGRVRHDDQSAARVTPAFVVSAYDHQSRQFAVGAGIGLEREGMEPCQFAERAAEQGAHRFSAAYRVSRLQRVKVTELRQLCHFLVQFRVIFHRARA